MKKLLAIASLLMIGALPVASFGWTVTAEEPVANGWGVDTAHTEINFSVNHFFTPVTGAFEDYDITLDYNADNPAASSVEARIAIASVNTGNERRDDHLRTGDWFEVETYPYMSFRSTSVEETGGGNLLARGILEIKGQKRQVELPITLLGVKQIPEQMQEMLGGAQEIASFRAELTIDRGDYGVGVGDWAATIVVGGEVKIEILLEAHRK